MPEAVSPRIAVVDFGMGNLHSVTQACAQAGLDAAVTTSPEAVVSADAVVLPGVGAFGDAMAALKARGLDDALRHVAASGTPLVGICLGMQLLMTESREFGRFQGLDIVTGEVVWLEPGVVAGRAQKVPQVNWNQLHTFGSAGADTWAGTVLDGLPDGVSMYFLHSLYVRPADPRVVIATTGYGTTEFCSALQCGNVFACQCHPERSGSAGLEVFRNLARRLHRARARKEDVPHAGTASQ